MLTCFKKKVFYRIGADRELPHRERERLGIGHKYAILHRPDEVAAIRDIRIVRDENDRLIVLFGESRE